MKKKVNAVVYYLSFPLLWIISRLPFSLFYYFSDLVCFLLYKIVGYRKSVVRSNLKRAFPKMQPDQLQSIEKQFYSHLCDLFLEIIKSMGMSKEEMLERFQVKNIEVLKTFEQQNRSIFLDLWTLCFLGVDDVFRVSY